MTKPEISGIAPFFIVKDVPAALAFYRDHLGFDITFQGPEPDDIFFGIVQRDGAMAAEFLSRNVEFSEPLTDTHDGLRGFELTYLESVEALNQCESASNLWPMASVALVVIDIQQAAFDGVFCPPIDRAADLVANAGTLITAARATGTPVVFVPHCEGKGEPFEEGTPHWQFHEQLTPQAGDLVVRKCASSAFENTDLQARLDALGARELVVCGLQSDFCVSNTSKSALSLGYRVRIASDGHSTWDLDREAAQAISERVNGELQSLGAVLEPVAGIATSFGAATHPGARPAPESSEKPST